MATLGTFTSGQVLTASELNKLNNVTALWDVNYQSISTVTPTAITFGAGTEVVDVSDWHSTTTNPERITPNIGGIYLVVASHQLVYAGSTIAYEVAIWKNGTQISGSLSDGGFYPGATAAIVVYLNGSTDYVYSSAYQSSGSNQNVFRRAFSCTLLRTA